MKYSELHKKLRGIGCIVTGKQRAGHPEWFSPITGKLFVTSNHLSHEVANGTLKMYKKRFRIRISNNEKS